MALKCPKCGYNTLDYKASFNLWKCVRADCGYQRKLEKNETNPHIKSLGFAGNNCNYMGEKELTN